MFAKLMTWVSNVSSTDPDEVRRQRLLNTLLIGIGSIDFVIFLIGVTAMMLGRSEAVTLVLGTLAALIGIMLVYFVNRYISGSIASILFLFILIVATAIADTPRHVVEGRSLFHFTIPIFIASAILRPWASFVMAGISGLTISAIAWLFLEDYARGVPPIPSVVGFFAVAFISWLSARSLERALENVREANRAAQREIVERKRTEAALKESEVRYRALIDMCPDSFVLTDLEGTYLMCNQQTVNLMEAESAGDLLGTNVLERILGPDRMEAERLMREAMERDVVHNIEYDLKTVRGHQFPAEINAALLRDAEGRPSGFIGLTRDVTKRKEAEGVLRRSNAELRAINAIHVALSSPTDLSGELANVLEEVHRLLPEAGLWFHAHPSGDGKQQEIEIERGIDRLGAFSRFRSMVDKHVFELKAPITLAQPEDPPVILQGDDETPLCQAIGLPLMVQGDVIGVLGALRSEEEVGKDNPFRAVDLRFLHTVSWRVSLAVENIWLTQEAADAQALRELNRMRSELIANFSHNLKTPLGLIKMSCTTLMREDADFDVSLQREMLQDIDAQTNRLASIVDRVLELGQLESGKLRLRRQSADLVPLVERVVSSVRKSSNGCRIVCSLSGVPLPVYVDEKRIEQVLHNLLNNAVKYSPAD